MGYTDEEYRAERMVILAKVDDVIETLGEIGENDMGWFKTAEAGFYHGVVDMLLRWRETIDIVHDDEDNA